jgi:hypothetical protein
MLVVNPMRRRRQDVRRVQVLRTRILGAASGRNGNGGTPRDGKG